MVAETSRAVYRTGQPVPQIRAVNEIASAPARWASGIFATLAVVGFWLLMRPYPGIIHDARLYIGAALAHSAPNGVGRDLTFAQDGQFGFSVFPQLARTITGIFGVSLGAMLLSLAGLLVWIGAILLLARQLACGPTRWLIPIFVAVLPAAYGSFDALTYGEAFAVPRPFAEAGVMLALALALSGRKLLAVLPLLVAAAFHPIMALPGVGLWLVLLLADLRKPLKWGALLALALAFVATTGAALHAPVLRRLFVVMDPQWRAIVETRAPMVFIGHWHVQDLVRVVNHATALVIAASLVERRLRVLFLGTVALAAAGLLASFVFGDLLSSLLIVQIQLWRVEWIMTLLGSAALAVCAIGLWRCGATARLTLALLAIGWVAPPSTALVALISIAALALHLVWMRTRLEVRQSTVTTAWALVALVVLSSIGLKLYLFSQFIRDVPEAHHLDLQFFENFLLPPMVICIVAVAWALGERSRPSLALQIFTGTIMAVAACVLWDDRSPVQVDVDLARPKPELVDILKSRRGEILWPSANFEAWSWSGQSNWTSKLQGTGVVFSRPLALTWFARVQRVIDDGLADNELPTQRWGTGEPEAPPITVKALDRFCSAPDAPAWVIAPVEAATRGRLPQSRFRTWTAAFPDCQFDITDKAVLWRCKQEYAVIPCHGQ